MDRMLNYMHSYTYAPLKLILTWKYANIIWRQSNIEKQMVLFFDPVGLCSALNL